MDKRKIISVFISILLVICVSMTFSFAAGNSGQDPQDPANPAAGSKAAYPAVAPFASTSANAESVPQITPPVIR